MGEQLTESDVKKIKEEIEYRKIVVRKKELEAVKEARAQGDLSENFEYKAAKQAKLWSNYLVMSKQRTRMILFA